MLFRELIYQFKELVLLADYTGQLNILNWLFIALKNDRLCHCLCFPTSHRTVFNHLHQSQEQQWVHGDNHVIVQSKDFTDGVPRFWLFIKRDLTVTSFHRGSSCSIPSLSSNKIIHCKLRSVFDEIITFLQNKENLNK